jgi:hypothetical protein
VSSRQLLHPTFTLMIRLPLFFGCEMRIACSYFVPSKQEFPLICLLYTHINGVLPLQQRPFISLCGLIGRASICRCFWAPSQWMTFRFISSIGTVFITIINEGSRNSFPTTTIPDVLVAPHLRVPNRFFSVAVVVFADFAWENIISS